jgi:hypothetical protein
LRHDELFRWFGVGEQLPSLRTAVFKLNREPSRVRVPGLWHVHTKHEWCSIAYHDDGLNHLLGRATTPFLSQLSRIVRCFDGFTEQPK